MNINRQGIYKDKNILQPRIAPYPQYRELRNSSEKHYHNLFEYVELHVNIVKLPCNLSQETLFSDISRLLKSLSGGVAALGPAPPLKPLPQPPYRPRLCRIRGYLSEIMRQACHRG
jgi:hypothetical protein